MLLGQLYTLVTLTTEMEFTGFVRFKQILDMVHLFGKYYINHREISFDVSTIKFKGMLYLKQHYYEKPSSTGGHEVLVYD